MNPRILVAAAMVGATSLLVAGCAEMNFVSDLFSTKKTINLKGERIPVMAAENTIGVDADLASVNVQLPPPYVNSEWPSPGGYPSNAMYHLQADGPLQQIWEQDAGQGSNDDSRLTAPPIVAGGRIYVLDSEAHIFAFDAGSGKPLWDESLVPQEGSTNFWNDASLGLIGRDTRVDASKGSGGGAAFDDGKLFVATGFGIVYALDAASGKQLWKTDLGVPIINGPVANGGRVFVSSQDNHFVAMAEADGRQLWDHNGIAAPAGILESTSAAVAGQFVIVPYTSGEIYAINVETGRPAWSDTLTSNGMVTALSELDDIAGRPVVDRDMVFAISHSGLMAGLSFSTGQREWAQSLGGINTPWVAGDWVYVLTTDNKVLCLERKDGKVKWIHQLPRWEDPKSEDDLITWSGPVLVSNRLVLVSSDGQAVSLSPYTGEELGKVDIPDGAYIAPIVANGTLYILTNDAQLIALR